MSAEYKFKPKIPGMICNWCCYGGADLCGVSRFQYPPHIRLIRVMCSGRVDLKHILLAFSTGQDAVFVGGVPYQRLPLQPRRELRCVEHGEYVQEVIGTHRDQPRKASAGMGVRRLRDPFCQHYE